MPRPFTTQLNCDNDWRSFGFQFWVPSLDAPEEDQRFSGTNRPQERRPDRISDDVIIKVVEVVPYDPKDFPQGSPTDKRIENLRRLKLISISKMPLLSKAQIVELAGRGDEHTYWWYLISSDSSLVISCYSFGERSPCRGTLSAKHLQMDVLFYFSMDALWRYEEIVNSIMELLSRWKR